MTVTSYAGAVLGPVVGGLIVGAVLLGIVRGIMSAPVTFKQVFAILCYASVPGIIQTALKTVVMFLKKPGGIQPAQSSGTSTRPRSWTTKPVPNSCVHGGEVAGCVYDLVASAGRRRSQSRVGGKKRVPSRRRTNRYSPALGDPGADRRFDCRGIQLGGHQQSGFSSQPIAEAEADR